MKGEAEVRRRISYIDGVPPDNPVTLVDDLVRLVQIMSGLANDHASEPLMGSPSRLDELTKECVTLRRIAASAPALTPGNFSRRQLWTGVTDSHRDSLPAAAMPSAHNLRHLSSSENPRIKPAGAGLYTSTPLPGLSNASMWLIYLEHYGEALFPGRRYTYELIVSPEARIYEIDTANSWARLIHQYHVKHKELVYPDWPRIATDYDAVHFTLPAIVAMQEIQLTLEDLAIARGYWDTEQTFWLNWKFDSMRLL